MNNRNFVQYVTGTAFYLTLTKPQIKGLHGLSLPKNSLDAMSFLACNKVVQALMYKGLVEYGDNGPELTEPGKLVVELLKIAQLIQPVSKKQLLPVNTIKKIQEEVSGKIPEHSRSRKSR